LMDALGAYYSMVMGQMNASQDKDEAIFELT